MGARKREKAKKLEAETDHAKKIGGWERTAVYIKGWPTIVIPIPFPNPWRYFSLVISVILRSIMVWKERRSWKRKYQNTLNFLIVFFVSKYTKYPYSLFFVKNISSSRTFHGLFFQKSTRNFLIDKWDKFLVLVKRFQKPAKYKGNELRVWWMLIENSSEYEIIIVGNQWNEKTLVRWFSLAQRIEPILSSFTSVCRSMPWREKSIIKFYVLNVA